jgi:hypothetical protein
VAARLRSSLQIPVRELRLPRRTDPFLPSRCHCQCLMVTSKGSSLLHHVPKRTAQRARGAARRRGGGPEKGALGLGEWRLEELTRCDWVHHEPRTSKCPLFFAAR